MKYVWLTLLAVLRPFYLLYSLWCLSFIPAVALLGYLLCQHAFPSSEGLLILKTALQAVLLLLVLIIPAMVFIHRSKGDPNPFQSAFMSWFGTLRWFSNSTPAAMVKVGLPSGYLVENPKSYRINGTDMRQILNLIQPGDILLRAYDGYMDGAFIKRSSLCSKQGYKPGWFTHAALYGGALADEDQAKVPEKFRHDGSYFQQGSQMVLHSMAKGVHCEDILTWCRCDYMAVLRIKPTLTQTTDGDAAASSCPVDCSVAIQTAKLSALEKIGEPYDFECIETEKFNRFSCAELVYYCYRGIHDALGLAAQAHAFFPFGLWARHFSLMQRITVTPDDFYALAKAQHLELVWVDRNTRSTHDVAK